jgi:polysaccharide deacetylase family protein (PEP-CTERM system associated)
VSLAAAARLVNAMTIDVEEYFHASVFNASVCRADWSSLESRVVASTERLLSIFAEHDVHGSFFVLGTVAERYPDLVKRIAAAGHEIASHGYWHELIYEQTPAAFREDIRRAKGLLESQCGVRVRGFRAPSYSITNRSLWALDALIDEGYEYDASIFPIHHDRYGIPGAPRHPYVMQREGGRLVEAPPSTVRVGSVNLPVAGGGYFRLLPYAWTRWGMRRLNRRERKPAIFYLHPWEIDPQQPRLALGRMNARRHYANLDRTEPRLRRLLADFRFGRLSDLLDGLESRSYARAAAH